MRIREGSAVARTTVSEASGIGDTTRSDYADRVSIQKETVLEGVVKELATIMR